MGGKGSGGARKKQVRFVRYPFSPNHKQVEIFSIMTKHGIKIQTFLRTAVDKAIEEKGYDKLI